MIWIAADCLEFFNRGELRKSPGVDVQKVALGSLDAPEYMPAGSVKQIGSHTSIPAQRLIPRGAPP